MSFSVTRESFASLTSYWTDSSRRLKWGSIFVLPSWLEVWWQEFQPETELYLAVVRQDADILGIAPLQRKGEKAFFIGSDDVCDYLDFIIVPGREAEFFTALLDDLNRKGVNSLELGALRPDSTVLTHLVGVAMERGSKVLSREVEVTVEMDLPASWEEYLALLPKKRRHEVKRKLRRLWEGGNVDYLYTGGGEGVKDLMDIFLRLFSLSRGEKAGFMTARRESFFRSLAAAMGRIGLLRFGILKLDNLPVAMTMGFVYSDTVYLYNSAYDPQYEPLSVGLLSKVLCIKESIEKGRKKWDFLKGAEEYKYQLGGNEIPLYDCQITIKG